MRELRTYEVMGYLSNGKRFSVRIIATSVDTMMDEFSDYYADCTLADYREVNA